MEFNDKRWLIREYEEEIFDLRDQLNAAMDTIFSLATENNIPLSDAAQEYEDHLEAHREMRTGGLDIGNL